MVKFHTKDKALMVHAFGWGILSGTFNDSLIRNWAKTFGEIRRRAIAHIDVEEEVTVKHGSTGLTKPREGSRAQSMRVHKAGTEKRLATWHAPYAPKKHQTRSREKGDLPCRHKSKMNYKELITIPGVADKLRFPQKTNKNLGPSEGI